MTFDKIIILDLDETLIHAVEKPLERVQDFVVGPYFVYLRPHARSFIDFCFASFSAVAVWTSSSKDYAEEISLNLFGSKKEDLAFLWSQERCVRKFDYKRYASYWIKDLKKVKRRGYALEKIIAIDDSPEKLYRQYGNLVRVLPFEGLVSDDELLHLQQYLTVLAEADNIRQIEKRGWQSKMSATKIEQDYQYVKERFKTLVANVPGAIYRCADDIYWTMEFLNDEITAISGYAASDFVGNQGRSFNSIIYLEDRDRVVREVHQAIAQKKSYTIEYRIIRSDGTIAWIKDKGKGIFDKDGELQWLDGIILDITEKKQSETALQHSESQLRLITDALPALIAYVDRRQCYQFVNKTYESWHKQPHTKIIGSHLREVLGEADYQKIKHYVELALSGQRVNYENEVLSSNSQASWVNVTYIPNFNSEGKVAGFFSLVNDISDRKATEQMKDEFVSVVSHELRTPLTSIYGALKLIVTNPQSGLSSEDREMLNIAVTNTDRLMRLVNDVLDLERIASGKVKMVKQPCDTADLIREAIEVMQPMAKAENITLIAKPIAIAINVDCDHIHQTLINLISNAIKFSTPNSSVQVTVEDLEREVLFKVIDTGRGIPADVLGSIFERFRQVDASDSRDKGGTGLGLPICYKIIEEHGGRIWADSEFGEGSTFYFTLPKSNLESSEELSL